MKSNSHVTRRLTVVAATTALAITLAGPAHADRDWLPGGLEAFPAVTSSVPHDARATRPGPSTPSILENDRAHHNSQQIAAAESIRPDARAGSRQEAVGAGTPAGGDARFDRSDVLGLALLLGVLGLLAVGIVYSNRRFQPGT